MTVPVEEVFNYGMRDIAGWWVGEREIGVICIMNHVGYRQLCPVRCIQANCGESGRASQNSEWAVKQAEWPVPRTLMVFIICTMDMWILNTGQVSQTQEDLSIVSLQGG